MEARVKQPNTKPRQFELMINFMQEHSDLAKGQIKGLAAKQTSNNLWKRLEVELNSCGPPTHNFVEWKKIWADYKTNIKAKLRRNKENMSGTGGGPSRFCTLTAMEEQVVDLLSIEDSINGEAQTMRFGANVIDTLPSSRVDLEPYHEGPSYDAENQLPNICPNTLRNPLPNNVIPTRARSVPPGRDNLLKQQIDNQVQYHENSVEKLKEISEALNSLSKYAKRNIELEEAKLQLEREKFEFKKKNEKLKRKLKVKLLKIKSRR